MATGLTVECPSCHTVLQVKATPGYQRVECGCGHPAFLLVEALAGHGEAFTIRVLRFDIEGFASFLKRSKKPVEVFNTKTGLLYSGCDRAYVLPSGAVDGPPVVRAKINRWIQEYLLSSG
jgi:hypothetical protein